MYENGEKIGEKLNDQRKYLRKYYEQNKDERAEFCYSISLLTEFYKDIWDNKKTIQNITNNITEDAKVGLSVLIKTDHTLTIPVLARYYTEYILLKNNGNKRFEEFNSVIKAIVCFSLFWRLLNSGNTAGIDDIGIQKKIFECWAKNATYD